MHFDCIVDTVNPTKCGCPFALKMAACQLLLEITTFLRETFPCLPRPRAEPLVVSIHNVLKTDYYTHTKNSKIIHTQKYWYNQLTVKEALVSNSIISYILV